MEIIDTTSVIVNLNNNPKTITIDGIPYNLQSVAEGSSIYYIQSNGTNVAIYDDNTKQIISAGKDATGQNNSINFANNSRFTPTADGNSYADLQQLEVNSLSYDTNSTPPTVTLNGCTFNLTDYNSATKNYKIAGLEGTLFNPASSQIQLPGKGLTYFAAYGNNNTFYALEGTIGDVDEINSVTININNNTNTGTITINGTPYNLQSIEGSNGIYYIQSNGTNVAIYDSTTKQIVSAGLGNSATIAQVTNSTTYINLQNLDITSLSYNTNSTPPTLTLNDHTFNLTNYDSETGEYKIAGLDDTTSVIVNLNNNPKTITIDGIPYNLQSVAEGSSVYYIQDQTNNNNLAIYDSNAKEIVSAGKDTTGQNNSINLANNSRFAQTVDGNSYADLQQLEVNSLLYNTNSTPPTITLNGYEFELEPISGQSNQYKIAGLEGTLFNPTTGQIQLPGQAQATYFVIDKNNNFYSIDYPGITYDLNNNYGCKIQFNKNYFEGYEDYIGFLKSNQYIGRNFSLYALDKVDDKDNIYYIKHVTTGKKWGIYDASEKQVITAGQYNLIDLDNDPIFAIMADEEVYINLQNLNITSLSYNIDDTTQTITLNGYKFNLTDYNQETGEYKIAGLDSATFNPTTGELQLPGQNNSINLNNTFTLSNGVYTRNPQNTPEHTPATTDMNGPDDDAGGTPNRLFSSARPSITTSVTATPPNITPDMTVQDNNIVSNTELENLNVQSMSIVYDEFNLPVSINLNDNNYSLEFNPNTGKYYIANSTTSTLDTSTGTVTLSENNIFKYLSIDSNQYYILSANALDASEILTYNVSDDINSVIVTNINGTITTYNLVGEENNIKYLVDPNNLTEKLAVFNVSTGEIIYAGQNYISLPQDMIMPDMAVLPSDNTINGNNNDNNIISNDTKQALSDLLRNNNNTIKGYIADGNLEGLKEYLNNEIQNTLPGAENQEIASLAQQVINDMQLEGTKTYEDFIEKLNQSLELNNLPTLDVGLEALENLTDSGTINIDVNGMNTGSMVTYILIASVATGLTSLAVNRINNKLQKKDLEKDLKKMNKRLEVRRRESLAKNSDGKKMR